MYKYKYILKIKILTLAVFILTSCGPLLQVTRIGQTLPPLPSDAEVKVYNNGDLIYLNANKIGTIYIGDTGFTIGQTYDVALNLAKKECRKMGGNAIELVRVVAPNIRSTSYVITANAYKVNTKKIDNSIERTKHTKSSLINNWKKDGIESSIEGIYERVTDNNSAARYELAVKKIDENTFYIIYLSGVNQEVSNEWKEGDLKGICKKTASPNLYKVEWYMLDKTQNTGVYATFDREQLTLLTNDGKDIYLKMYPYADDEPFNNGMNRAVKWTGTGFAINRLGYIVTNYHVINSANNIYVYGVNGDFNKGYSATVVASDPKNDLAIIKVEDSAIGLIETPPYGILFKTCDVGSDVTALGFPLTSTMGEELKVTNGIISAKTGFQGDATTYQVSAPTQPGNSGGPLFNSDGDVIGIISSKHKATENVSYAIKSSYLYSLVMSSETEIELSHKNTLRGLPLTKQVANIRNFVFLLKCD